MARKPRLSFWQIWNMSFGFLGIQFGFALQNANVSRIFETLGADIALIPILWIAAPVTGLIVQPIVGYLSDNTWNKLGRRRPYFLLGAILASAALFIMPNSPVLWVAAGMLWILDASINITMEPFRAFVGDMLPSEQRTKGFAMQSFFIGIAAFVGSFLPYLMTEVFNISNTAPEGMIPDSVKFSFYIGGIIFFLSVLWTVYSTKEYSPEELKEFEEAEQERLGVDSEKIREEVPTEDLVKAKSKHSPFIILAGIITTAMVYFFDLEQELYILTIGILSVGLLLLFTISLQKSGSKNGLVVVSNDLYLMPKTMKQLAVVQFFSWFALFAMWIYTTAGVTAHIYDMGIGEAEVTEMESHIVLLEEQTEAEWYRRLAGVKRDVEGFREELESGATEVSASMRVVNFFMQEDRADITESLRSNLQRVEREYNEGANWVGVAFAIYNGFAALVAFLLPVMARYTNRKTTHAVALVAGAIGLISVYFISDPMWILVSMVGVGLAWASILSMPYAILAGSLPAAKMGTYMGIFNFFIVLPQILAASILGVIVGSLFSGQAIFALVLGGATWILAAGLTFLVDDVDDPDHVPAEVESNL